MQINNATPKYPNIATCAFSTLCVSLASLLRYLLRPLALHAAPPLQDAPRPPGQGVLLLLLLAPSLALPAAHHAPGQRAPAPWHLQELQEALQEE